MTSWAHPYLEALMPYVVGLVGIRERGDGMFDLVHVGSGSLFEIGGIRGIVTAGHVIEELERPRQQFTKWALISFATRGDRSPLHHFPALHARTVRLGSNYEAMDGPDIGFVRLPPDTAERLDRPYFSMTARYKRYVAEGVNAKPANLNALFGVIGRRSKMIKQLDNITDVETTIMASPCMRVDHQVENGFDYDTFELLQPPAENRPPTYGGVSGGPVFAFAEDMNPATRWVTGVIIRENPEDEDGHRTFVAHGLLSIYSQLVELVATNFDDAVWPEASTDAKPQTPPEPV